MIEIERLPHAEGLDLPAYATEGSAGMDLCAAIETPIEIQPGARVLIPSGFAIALRAGLEAQIRPRSGLALKHGIAVMGGTIDSDYRGEIGVILANHGQETFVVRRGDRVAQMVVARYERSEIREVDALEDTARGSGGFGSTGR